MLNGYEEYEDTTEEPSLEELIEQIEHSKKRLFLKQYNIYKFLTKTAQAIGVSWQSVYYWLGNDKVFLKAFEATKKEIESVRLSQYEAELDKRVLENPSKQSDVLLMFGLKSPDPQKYRDRPPMEAVMPGNITFVMNMPPRVDSPDQI